MRSRIGIVTVFAGAPFSIPEFETLLAQGGELTWNAGPLVKGSNWCHGAGGNGHSWHKQIAHLAGAHSPISLDLPGHGRSSGTDGMNSIREYADFVAAFLDALQIKSAVIAGHSMGGAIAMQTAAMPIIACRFRKGPIRSSLPTKRFS